MKWMADKCVLCSSLWLSVDALEADLEGGPARSMSASSRQRTLHTLSEFRPTFRVRPASSSPSLAPQS